MSKGINRAFLLGHVGKDPEIRSTTVGRLLRRFRSPPPTDRRTDRQLAGQDGVA